MTIRAQRGRQSGKTSKALQWLQKLCCKSFVQYGSKPLQSTRSLDGNKSLIAHLYSFSFGKLKCCAARSVRNRFVLLICIVTFKYAILHDSGRNDGILSSSGSSKISRGSPYAEIPHISYTAFSRPCPVPFTNFMSLSKALKLPRKISTLSFLESSQSYEVSL